MQRPLLLQQAAWCNVDQDCCSQPAPLVPIPDELFKKTLSRCRELCQHLLTKGSGNGAVWWASAATKRSVRVRSAAPESVCNQRTALLLATRGEDLVVVSSGCPAPAVLGGLTMHSRLCRAFELKSSKYDRCLRIGEFEGRTIASQGHQPRAKTCWPSSMYLYMLAQPILSAKQLPSWLEKTVCCSGQRAHLAIPSVWSPRLNSGGPRHAPIVLVSRRLCRPPRARSQCVGGSSAGAS